MSSERDLMEKEKLKITEISRWSTALRRVGLASFLLNFFIYTRESMVSREKNRKKHTSSLVFLPSVFYL
jgi:hypothetical protein